MAELNASKSLRKITQLRSGRLVDLCPPKPPKIHSALAANEKVDPNANTTIPFDPNPSPAKRIINPYIPGARRYARASKRQRLGVSCHEHNNQQAVLESPDMPTSAFKEQPMQSLCDETVLEFTSVSANDRLRPPCYVLTASPSSLAVEPPSTSPGTPASSPGTSSSSSMLPDAETHLRSSHADSVECQVPVTSTVEEMAMNDLFPHYRPYLHDGRHTVTKRANPTLDAKPTNTSHLMNLPREIRAKIFRYRLQGQQLIFFIPEKTHSIRRKNPSCFEEMAVNRQYYTEYMNEFCQRCEIVFDFGHARPLQVHHYLFRLGNTRVVSQGTQITFRKKLGLSKVDMSLLPAAKRITSTEWTVPSASRMELTAFDAGAFTHAEVVTALKNRRFYADHVALATTYADHRRGPCQKQEPCPFTNCTRLNDTKIFVRFEYKYFAKLDPDQGGTLLFKCCPFEYDVSDEKLTQLGPPVLLSSSRPK